MLDGAIAMAALDQADANPDAQDNQQTQSKEPAAQSNSDSEVGNNSASEGSDGAADATPPGDRIVIIVDAAVADAQELLAGVDPSAEIFYLSAGTDGVHQITALLAGETGIAELHILSHGETGSVTLGNMVLSAANAEAYASEFTVWDSALKDGADILLYGCNIGEDAAGKAFLDVMADLTNADLAASDDLTGGTGLGGNWDLEVATGTIEAGLPLDAAAVDGYAHTLLFVPTNTAPSLSGLTTSLTVLEREAPVVLDSDVTVADQEQNWNGGILTISGLDANDVLAVQTVGNGAGETSVTGNTISVGGTAVATFTGGTAGTNLVITFNANANNASVERVIENLVFSNGSDTPTAARTLSLTLVDAGGMEAIGTTQTLTERQGSANPLDGISVSRAAAPTFVDIDADGDLDVFMGSVNGDLRFFRNVGSPQVAAYSEETGTNNPFNGLSVTFDSSPTSVDIDNNGVLDAFVGQQDGTVVFFRNTGTDTAPVFVRVDGAGNPLNAVDTGFLAAPTFVDIDNDGDFDAFVGAQDGSVLFYRNTGNPNAPAFSLETGTSDPFNGFDFGALSKPDFVDFDGDGDFDAIVGSLDSGGKLTYVRNDGTPNNPNFTIVTGTADPFNPLSVQAEARPVFADIDGDGDPDLFVGGFDGTTAFFETDTRFDIAANVTAVNSTPVVTPPAASLNATGQTDLAIHGAGFSAADADAGSGPGTLTLTVGEGTLTVDVGDSGVTIISGNGSGTVVLEGTLAEVNALLGGAGTGTILYRATGVSPSPSTTISVTYNDRGATGVDPGLTADDLSEEGTASQTITITPGNQPPIIIADREGVLFRELDGDNDPGNLGGLQFLSAVNFTVTDPDSTAFTVITINLTNTLGNAVAGDTLRVRPADHGAVGTALRDKLDNATITGNDVSNQITVTAGPGETFTAAEVEAILERLRLVIAEDSQAGPVTRDKTITVTDDGNATSVPFNFQVEVEGVNDTPTFERANQFPNAQAFTDEDTPLNDVFQSVRDFHTANTSNLNQFDLQDRDDDTNVIRGTPEQMTLRVTNGTLTFTPGSGVTLVSGNGTNEVVVEGTIAALRNFINANGDANLIYTPNTDFNGVDTLTMRVTDQGDLPIEGNVRTSDDRTILINVAEGNRPPVNTVPEPQVMDEDTTLVFSAANGNGLSVVDVDSGNGSFTTTLSVTTGTLEVATGGGATIGGNGGSVVTVTGTLAQVNAALASITYTPPPDFNGPVTMTVDTSDGFTGQGGPLTDNDTVAITVNPVNDQPINTMPSNQATSDDTPLVFSPSGGNGLSVSDIDAGSGVMTTTLSVTSGTLAAANGGGATVNGNGTGTVVISGTTAQINAALAGLTYTPVDLGTSNQTVILSMTTNDNGNTGSGGPLSATNQITIEVDGGLVSPGPDEDPDPNPTPEEPPESETDGLFDGDPLDVGQLPSGPALFDDLEPFLGEDLVDPIVTAGIGGEPPLFGNPFDPDNLPGNIDLVPESDTGLFDNDDITRDNTPELTGLAPADTRVVITSSIAGVIGTVETDENGAWRFQAPTMVDGAHELIATPIDEEGSEGTASVPLLVIIDTQAPETPPAPSLDGEIDQLRANEQVPLRGTSEPGARIIVTSDKDGVVGEVVTDDNGNWSLVIAPLSADSHAIQVTAVDVAGNSSDASPALALTVLPEDDSASLGASGSQELAHLLSGFTGPAGESNGLHADAMAASNSGAVGFTRQVQLAGL